MQHILIPTDFSKNAWNATMYAMGFFAHTSITIHFLHIDISMQLEHDKELHYAGFSTRKSISEDTKAAMAKWMSKVYAHNQNPKHSVKNSIVQAPFIDGIRQYIDKNAIQLIVMGTKGASGLKELTIGSKAGAVIIKVKCPILVIPEEAQFQVPLQIGFPTDFNITYKNRVVNTLLEITNIHKSSIKVLRVAQTQQPLDNFQNNNRDFLRRKLKDIPHSFHVIENPHLEHALQSFVDTMKIDMVAMIAKNLNFFQRILFRPKVAQISYHVRIPFLVLHE